MNQIATQPFTQTEEGNDVYRENLQVIAYEEKFVIFDKGTCTFLCAKREDYYKVRPTTYCPLGFGREEAEKFIKKGDMPTLQENVDNALSFVNKFIEQQEH